MNGKPEFIRVKRRRDDESVQTLVVDEESRAKRSKFIYKKTNTVDLNFFQETKENTTPLLKLSDEVDQKHFVLEQFKKRRRSSAESDDVAGVTKNKIEPISDKLPEEVNKMLNDYLKLNEGTAATTSTQKKKPSRKHFKGDAAKVASLPSLDYVYDIYHLEKLNADEADYLSSSAMGHIRIVNIDIDLVHDEETDEEQLVVSDDDDSNEENFYRNDYPEDEDDDRSVLFGSEGEKAVAEAEDFERIRYEQSQVEAEQDAHAVNPLGDHSGVIQEEYSELFSRIGASDDILKSLNRQNFIDVDSDYDDIEDDENDDDHLIGNDGFQRNLFFSSDQDDPLAIHRDEIFGKLQKMINKK